MRPRRRLLAAATVIALSASSGACGGALSHELGRTLRTPDSSECRAYVTWEHGPVTDVFLWMNGTGTGSSAFLPPEARELLSQRTAAFVTFDKPGVSAPFGDPGAVHIDDAPFRRHTQGTLLACARRALVTARALFGASARWHFRGHSEGALIALDLYDALLTEDPAEAANVRTLVLSGLPLEPFGDILHRQLADLPALAAAVQRCDWPIMRDHMGVSCAYLADATTRPSGRALFERIAARSPHVEIDVFQGISDWNTPVGPVRDLDAWNRAEGHLTLNVRTYDGAHRGTSEVHRELAATLLRSVPVMH